MAPVRTRFAPSPTGHLHIGGVRTALFNWLYARRHGGQFILRIDDTDQQRHVAEALRPILEGFRWLGLDWDEGPEVGGPYGPYFQSERTERYRAAVNRMLEEGTAYRDFARPEEIQAERQAAEQAGEPFRYSRRFMATSEEQAEQFRAEGRSAVVRLKMPDQGSCRFDDLVRGSMEFAWSQEQDHVIQRADGTCLYHLANVVDDHDFQISHVIRAVEHLSNTPRQIFIAQSLGYDPPQYAHLPYVAEPGSESKLSKRKLKKYLKHPDFRKLYDHGCQVLERIGETPSEDTFQPVLVEFYREVGYLPQAIINYVLMLGWSLDDKTEFFGREEMIESFSLERVNKSPASFDPIKLWSFQQHYMNELTPEEKFEVVRPFLQQAGWIDEAPSAAQRQLTLRLLEAAGDRIKTGGDVLDYPEFYIDDTELHYDEKVLAKRLGDVESQQRLRAFAEVLAGIEPFGAAEIEAALKAWIAEQQIGMGKIIHALRVAVTGRGVGIGMFETLELLGKEKSLHRIEQILKRVAGAAPVDRSSSS